MNKQQMEMALKHLNIKLAQNGIFGEVALYGGAVMCLVLNARDQTHDIDAIFSPKTEIRELARQTALELELPEDWFNDGVKGFVSENNDVVESLRLSNLVIYSAVPTYMFAMKAASSRMGHATDINDLRFLIRHIGIDNLEQAMKIIENYYPIERIPPRAKYLLTSLIEEYKGGKT